MAWIESHDDIWEHHKTIRLCELLGEEPYQVVGRLTALWHFILRNAWRDADLTKWGAVGVARACYYKGDAERFLAMLQESGFLDGFVAHGWVERAGRLVMERINNENKRLEKEARIKSKNKSSAEHRTNIGRSSDEDVRLPNPTQPNPTEQKTTSAPTAERSEPEPILSQDSPEPAKSGPEELFKTASGERGGGKVRLSRPETGLHTFRPENDRQSAIVAALTKCQRISISEPDIIQAWDRAFPDINIAAEILKADAWAVAKKVSRSPKGWARTMVSWLGRCQDAHRPMSGANAAPSRVVGGATPTPGKYGGLGG